MAALNEEQTILRDVAKSWVDERSPVSAFRKVRNAELESGFDPGTWKEMAELGWSAVIVPEDFGGAGLDYLTMGLIFEQLGRTLNASPLLMTGVGAVSAILQGGSPSQQNKWLPRISEGSCVAALAFEEGARHDLGNVSATAVKSGTGFVLNGQKTFVVDGMAANLLLVSAKVDDKIEVFLVPSDLPGIQREKLNLADGRGAALVSFKDVALDEDSTLSGGIELLEHIADRVRAVLSAEMLGSSIQAFETTVEYLKTRVQFGHVIGSFQALQHRAAAMLGKIELSRSVVEAALTAIDQGRENVPMLVSAAKAKVGDTYHLISNEMVQMHGGIGMTDEHDAGLYLKRARVTEAMFGNQSFHRDRYGRLDGY